MSLPQNPFNPTLHQLEKVKKLVSEANFTQELTPDQLAEKFKGILEEAGIPSESLKVIQVPKGENIPTREEMENFLDELDKTQSNRSVITYTPATAPLSMETSKKNNTKAAEELLSVLSVIAPSVVKRVVRELKESAKQLVQDRLVMRVEDVEVLFPLALSKFLNTIMDIQPGHEVFEELAKSHGGQEDEIRIQYMYQSLILFNEEFRKHFQEPT